jgi:diguanylate cyclase (GGDEF)-like protein
MVLAMIGIVEKLGRFWFTIFVTIFALLISRIITLTIYSLMDTQPPLSGTIASIASPILITPILSWWFIGLLLRIRELEKQMRELADIDGLTGLYNRNAFLIAFESLLHFAQRNQMNMIIMFIDIDNFKSINDTYGHDAGDAVLRKFSTFLKESLRDSDIVGRVGGDEFIISLPNTDHEGGLKIAELIREGITKLSIPTKSGLEISITISIGISMYSFTDEIDVSQIIKNADTAMYFAKMKGKNKIHNALMTK